MADANELRTWARALMAFVDANGLEYAHVYASADEEGTYAGVHVTDRDGITTSVSECLEKGGAND